MLRRVISKIAVKGLAILLTTVLSAGVLCVYTYTSDVSAYVSPDDGLYSSLYSLFKDRGGDPDNFMTQEKFVQRIMGNCELLSGIAYTYGAQENYLACDGFVSLVLRLSLDTIEEFERTYFYYQDNKYRAKFDYKEEHIVAASNVDKYEVFRPGGTSVTWLYHNYVDVVVDSRVTRDYVLDQDNSAWVNYLTSCGAQPGDIMFWDNDIKNDYWTHIGIYAGIEDGVAMMWHASSLKGKVCKQSLEEVTCQTRYLEYVSILPSTDRPVRMSLCTGNVTEEESNIAYSVYSDPECTVCKGHVSNCCDFNPDSYLRNIPVYPNDDMTEYGRSLYLVKDIPPYSAADQEVLELQIHIIPGVDGKGSLTYTVCGLKDNRKYAAGKVDCFDMFSGDLVIPVKDFR